MIVAASPAVAETSASRLTPQQTLVELIASREFNALERALKDDARVLVDSVEAGGEVDPADPEISLRLLLLATLKKLPTEEISAEAFKTTHREFLDWLFAKPDRLRLLLAELRPEDKALGVLECWSTLWQAEENAGFREKYAGLALALALIHDQPAAVPKAVEERYHPALTMPERYEYFRDESGKGTLVDSCARMPVRELVRVVDLKISKDEIDWVHRHVSGPASKAGNEYSEIEYLMERATDGENPYESYIMSEIKKHGGICGDQAHYSSNAAKTRAIPAMVVTGTGDRGPHAWLAFMPEDNEWAFHARQGITNGFIRCSQRGKQVSDAVILLEADEDYETAHRSEALLRITLVEAAIEAEAVELASKWAQAATREWPMNLDAWHTREAAMEAAGAEPDQWKDFIREADRRFEDHPPAYEWLLKLKIRHLYGELGDEDLTKMIEREVRKVARDAGTEGSALIAAIDQLGSLIRKEGDADALVSFYRSTFRRYGEEDLEMFGKIADSFQSQAGQIEELRPEIPEQLHRAYKRHAETNNREFFRAQMELSLLRQVVASYRRFAPDKDKEIEGLEKDIENRMERIKRAAN